MRRLFVDSHLGDSVGLQAGQAAPSFHLRVTSAFGEKHCIAVSALQEWPFNLQRQRLLLSQVFLDDEKDINTQLFVRVFDDGVDCFGLNHPIVAV